MLSNTSIHFLTVKRKEFRHFILALSPLTARMVAPDARYVGKPEDLRGQREATIFVHDSYRWNRKASALKEMLDRIESEQSDVLVIHLDDKDNTPFGNPVIP